MNEWHRTVQLLVDEIDACIRRGDSEELTLSHLAQKTGYSQHYVSRKFSEISGMKLRHYLRLRHLAFALKALRDTDRSILEIALDHGFSSHEAFTRAFKTAYGLTPAAYRRHPVPIRLRTLIRPLDCYLLEHGGFAMTTNTQDIKTYFITIPAHSFLHIRNYESIGYWDFWQKQSLIPGQDCETVCGILESIPRKTGRPWRR